MKAPHFIAGEPVTDSVPADTEQTGDLLAGASLPTDQEVEHLQAGLLPPVMFLLKPLFKLIDPLGDGWNSSTLPTWLFRLKRERG